MYFWGKEIILSVLDFGDLGKESRGQYICFEIALELVEHLADTSGQIDPFFFSAHLFCKLVQN